MVSFTNLLGLAVLAITGAVVNAQNCSDVHLVFARGTNQAVGLGASGIGLYSNLTAALPGKVVSAYAVEYSADPLQTSAGPGATVMTKHIVSYAASCPDAVFVIGGYSQGATVTDIAIGIKTVLGKGEVIPTELAPRIKAVVTFGNPIALFGQTIAKASALYGPKSIDYCNKGDPVCGGGLNAAAHMTYPTTAVPQAALRAAEFVLAPARSLRI